jgi:hypothetical protein
MGYKTTRSQIEHAATTAKLDSFDQFWLAYPKRKGANPKAQAKKKFTKLVDSGEDADKIIAGAKAYAAQESDKINTPFIAHALTWLNGRRWEDYEPEQPTTNGQGRPPASVFVEVDTDQWKAWKAHKKVQGKGMPETNFDGKGRILRGWWFETEWPPSLSSNAE